MAEGMDELNTILMMRKHHIALLDDETDDKCPTNDYISTINIILVPKAVTGLGEEKGEG